MELALFLRSGKVRRVHHYASKKDALDDMDVSLFYKFWLSPDFLEVIKMGDRPPRFSLKFVWTVAYLYAVVEFTPKFYLIEQLMSGDNYGHMRS